MSNLSFNQTKADYARYLNNYLKTLEDVTADLRVEAEEGDLLEMRRHVRTLTEVSTQINALVACLDMIRDIERSAR